MNAIQKTTCLLILFIITVYGQETFKIQSDSTSVESIPDTVETENKEEPDVEKIPIAIMEFETNGITQAEGKALTDRLRLEVFNCAVYDVMEREKMTKILDEMEFQLSGCTSNECMIEIGKIVGVKKMIAGSISKIGELYTVSSRLIDVEMSKIEATAIEDIEGTLGQVLTKAIPAVAAQISGLEKPEYIIDKKITAMNITTEPVGAHIFLDGIYKGISPLQIEAKPGYKHMLKAEKNTYLTSQKSFELAPQQIKDITIILSKEPEDKIIEVTKSEPEKKYGEAFKIRFSKSNHLHAEINDHIYLINEVLDDDEDLFKKDYRAEFDDISSFNGIEFFNSRDVGNFLGLDFGIALYRAEFEAWISDTFEGERTKDDDASLVIWSPQISFLLRISPISHPLFFPYFNVGYSYNLLFMTAYEENKSYGGPKYNNWGFVYGLGVEIRPFQAFGIALEWNYRMMDMEIMDIDNVSDRFKDNNLDNINISGENLGISVNFYY